MNRSITTLFMLESLDGKISSGDSDNLDADKDWCRINGVKEGLQQYYDIEQTTDLFSINTGRVMAKIGLNEKKEEPKKTPCSFIIIDNKPHLNENGIDYLCKWCKNLYLVTTNKDHIVHKIKDNYENFHGVTYKEGVLQYAVEMSAKYQNERYLPRCMQAAAGRADRSNPLCCGQDGIIPAGSIWKILLFRR